MQIEYLKEFRECLRFRPAQVAEAPQHLLVGGGEGGEGVVRHDRLHLAGLGRFELPERRHALGRGKREGPARDAVVGGGVREDGGGRGRGGSVGGGRGEDGGGGGGGAKHGVVRWGGEQGLGVDEGADEGFEFEEEGCWYFFGEVLHARSYWVGNSLDC